VIDQKEDFTTENYKQLINFISKNYSPIFFDEYDPEKENKYVLLRHDIDISLSNSLVLAKIEYHFGMKSTFFVNIHSEFYNFFEKGSIACLKEILKLGHSIGIHFDSTFWNLKDEVQLIKNLSFEKALIDEALEIKINVFSFHNPTEFVLSFKEDKYAGLINTYSNRFMNDFKYCSDSNGHWRHERMFDVVKSLDYDKLHLLTHPGWWTLKIKYPREKIYTAIYERAQFTLNDYDQNLVNSKRENLGGFTDQLFFIKDFSPKFFNLIDRSWNDKNYIQVYRELIQIIKKQLLEITLSYTKNNDSINLKNQNLGDEIDFHLIFIEKQASGFTPLKYQIYNLIHIKDITLYSDKSLINYIKRLVKLIDELKDFSVNK
tara:strand:+ start:4435 stop:5559 length:1125 start_codon:yes stop_codon:yes gene_type:complete